MNKTLGSTLITSGTMIGAGMLAMPLTSAGIGFTFTVVLLVLLWILLTYSALLFVRFIKLLNMMPVLARLPHSILVDQDELSQPAY